MNTLEIEHVWTTLHGDYDGEGGMTVYLKSCCVNNQSCDLNEMIIDACLMCLSDMKQLARRIYETIPSPIINAVNKYIY